MIFLLLDINKLGSKHGKLVRYKDNCDHVNLDFVCVFIIFIRQIWKVKTLEPYASCPIVFLIMIKVEDCVQELLKFVLQSSINQTLDFDLGLSTAFCSGLLKHDPSTSNSLPDSTAGKNTQLAVYFQYILCLFCYEECGLVWSFLEAPSILLLNSNLKCVMYACVAFIYVFPSTAIARFVWFYEEISEGKSLRSFL